MNCVRKFNVKVAKVLSVLLIVQQLFSFSMFDAYALGDLDFSSSMMSQLINDNSSSVAPGIQERRITLLNKEGKRVENFIIEVDLEGSPNTSIVTGSYQDSTNYGMTTVREQAEQAMIKVKPVVAAVNGDFYNMATGEPVGCFVKDGVEIKSLPSSWQFFGIKKDGTAIIGDYAIYQSNKGDLKEALGAQSILVQNGTAISSADTDIHPRTAVGIKDDGSVVFMVSDGRQEPYSAGLTLSELGQLMKDLGCVDALNLDGGGSSTYLSREQGTNYLACKNKPSDGVERAVANSFLILSDTPVDNVFDSAIIAPKDKTYTTDSIITFSAAGMDASGAPATLPEFSAVTPSAIGVTGTAIGTTTTASALSWQLSDDSFGTINPETGLFASSGKEGQVQVRLLFGNELVGSTYLEIKTPDTIYFVQNEISLEFDASSNLGFKAQYRGRDVILKDGDIIWNIPDGMGTMDSNNIFHTPTNGSASGIITASLKGTDLTASIDAKVGQLPVVLYDFEDGVGEWKPGTAGRGEIVSLESVDYASGEPVRFGDKSLKINFDLTGAQTNTTIGAYAGPSSSKDIPGAPKAIGAWIYATEEAHGYWLRMYVYDANGQYKPIDFTNSTVGIDWVGWKYVEANIPSTYQGPFKTYPNQMIRMMSLKSGASGPMTKGEVYVDNVRVVYGSSVDDMYHPIINDINLDGKTYNSSTVTISTSFTDDMSDEFATGMNYDRIHMYVDGKDYTNAPGIYALNKGQNTVSLSELVLPDGVHRIDVVVQDNFGNETKKTAYFTVDTGTGTKLNLDSPSSDAILGGIYKLHVISNNPSDIDSVIAKIGINKNFPVQSVDFGANDSISSYTYNADKGILELNIQNDDTSSSTLATINISIPANTLESQKLEYSVDYSNITYNTDKGENYAASFCVMPMEINITSGYNVEVMDILVGREGSVLVKDINGNPAEGVTVKVITDGNTTDFGVSGTDGIARGTAMTDAVKKLGIYAEKDGVISYTLNTQSLKPLKDKIPSNILANAVENSSTSKNISWMSNPLTSENAAIMQIALKTDYDANGDVAFTNVDGSFKEESFIGQLDINNNGLVRLNSVIATGLTAGENYIFRVGDGVNWSEIKEFKTTLDGAETNFFIMGDTQTSNTTNLEAVLNAITNDSTDYNFSMHVGDIIDEASMFNQLDAVSGALSGYAASSDVDLICALGNHEYMGDEDGHIAEIYYNTPKNGPEEALGSCYSVEYGNVYVAVISFTTSSELLQTQLDWLKQDAAKTDKTWKILLTHQPVYYSNPEGGNGLFKEMLPSVMDEVGIDFVFSGHDHAYGRTAQLKDGKVDPTGTTYMITGSTGEKYYDAVDDGSFVVFNDDKEPIYLTASASEEAMTIEALRPNGTVIDSFTIQKTIDNTLSLELEDVSANSGADVEIKLEMKNLIDLAGAKVKLGYDADKLTYKNIEFSDELQINATNTDVPGEIYFAALNAKGITKEVLEAVTITFTVNSDIKNQVQLPVNIISAEACDSNKEDISTKTIDGSILVTPTELPVASDVSFTGEVVVGQILTAKYTYFDPKSKPESGTTFRWLISEDEGNHFTAIDNENSKTLVVKSEYVGKEIKVEVKVKNGVVGGLAVTGDNGRNIVIKIGDSLTDGEVDYKDALHILQYTVEKVDLNEQTHVASDITGDQNVNIQDVIYILQLDVK